MASIIKQLTDQQLIHPPPWLPDNVRYECITGSIAYGVSTNDSDWDIIGFCIPPKDIIFPHLAGVIEGFGRQKQKFKVFEKQHINAKLANKKVRQYDVSIYNIVHYFQLCMDCNPNMIDTLFVPRVCIIHSSQISEMIREKRHLFLHKGAWQRFKGYSYSQLAKMSSKTAIGKRKESIEQYGYDVKYAYHVVRLLDEIEQILVNKDIDLQRNKEQLKAIRRGEISEKDIKEWANNKEVELEKIYNESKLPWGPDEDNIKTLLLQCLEEHFGNLDKCIFTDKRANLILRDIANLIDKNRSLIN